MKMALRHIAALAFALPIAAQADHRFAGDYYTSSWTTVSQFTPDGTFVRSVTPVDDEGMPRGIGFGPEGLYVVRYSISNGSTVQVYDRKGTVVRTFSFDGWLGGMWTSGNLQFAPSKEVFYVSALDGIYRFSMNGTDGTKFIQQHTTDVAVMPNGDLLVADDYSITHYTAEGEKLSRFGNIVDPYGLGVGRYRISNVRGVTYDPRTDTTFVNMLGDTAFGLKLLALEGTSNVMKGVASCSYCSEMHVTSDERLLVGSSSGSPGIFTFTDTVPMTLTQTGSLLSTDAAFVTSKPLVSAYVKLKVDQKK